MLANLHAIDRSDIIGCIIVNLCGLRIQAIDSRLLIIRFRLQSGNIRLVFRRLRHGIIDFSQCGGHARAILDLPRHRQLARFHVITGNRGTTDGSHIFQLLAVSRELTGFVLQSGDLAFIRGDTVSSVNQITLIRFSSNRGFKAPYTSHQSCNLILIRLLCHVCRHSFLDFIYPVSSQIAQVSICFVTQRRCNCGFISFITQLILQCGDTSFIRSNICLLIRHIFGQTASCITYRGLQRFNIRFIGCHFSSRPLRSKRKIYFCLFVCLISRINLMCYAGTFIHMHRCFRYAQSPAEERKRHERGQECMSSNPPDFFRSGSRLGMRPSDFRSDHIAILCFRPDDFVDVVHNDFPLCEE